MDAEAVLLLRGIERLMLVGLAAILLFFGYQLFSRASESISKIEGNYGSFKISLTSTAPGIFFSLFGTVLAASLAYQAVDYRSLEGQGIAPEDTQPAHVNPEGNPSKEKLSGDGEPSFTHVRYFGDISRTLDDRPRVTQELENAVAALHQLSLVIGNCTSAPELVPLVNELDPFIGLFAEARFGSKAVASFKTVRDLCESSQENCRIAKSELLGIEVYSEMAEVLGERPRLSGSLE